jgi:hypothetical protein
MANPTYTLIASNTVGSGGVSSITFSSIPATYTDLLLKISVRDNHSATASEMYMGFNGNGYTSNTRNIRLFGDGSAVYSDAPNPRGDFGISDSANATANTFTNTEIYIPNYTSANYKSWSADSVSENNAGGAGSAFAFLNAGLWSSTSAINRLDLYAYPSYSFVQYSTFYLYGINNS